MTHNHGQTSVLLVVDQSWLYSKYDATIDKVAIFYVGGSQKCDFLCKTRVLTKENTVNIKFVQIIDWWGKITSPGGTVPKGQRSLIQ